MPEIYRLHGIRIYMYLIDHAPPHIHAMYDDRWSRFRIDDGRVFDDGHLNKLATSVVRKWIRQHKKELMAAWHKAVGGGDPGKIGKSGR